MSFRMPGGGIEVVAKTADYTLTLHDMGKLFTNRGASGAVVFTLPDPATVPDTANRVRFFQVADQDMTIFSNEKIISLNAGAADSVAFATAGEKIGNAVEMISDGTAWLACLMTHETATPTITSD